MRRCVRWLVGLAAAGGLLLALLGSAAAQAEELHLSLRKQFGFSMGGQIQGTFKLSVQGPPDLAQVAFTLQADVPGGEPVVLGQASQAPFALTFNTDAYAPGPYVLSAAGQTSGGQALASNTLHVEFVSAEAGWQSVQKILIPLFVLVGIVMLLSFAVPLLLETRDKRPRRTLPAGRPLGEPRAYGWLGGTVCPKCGQPFGLHWWAPNLLTSKLDRCPQCGKWSMVRPASRQELAAAEAELAAQAAALPASEPGPEEKLRRQVEESRYVE